MRDDGAGSMRLGTLLWVGLTPALLFLALHARTLDYGFVWTDRTEIVEGGLLVPDGEGMRAFTEPRVGGAGGALWPYYRPLQVLLVSRIDTVAGLEPAAFRLASLVLGASTIALFALLALRWLGRPAAAVFAAAVPALHPAGLEVWVWIAGISAAMVALGLVASLSFAVPWMREGSARAALLAGAGCGVGYLLALFSKESALVLGPLLAAIVAGDVLARRAPAGRAFRLLGFEIPLRGLVWVGVVLALGVFHLAVVRASVLGPTVSVAIGGSRLVHLWTALSTWPSSLGWMLLPLFSTTSDVVAVVDRVSDPRPWLGLLLAFGSLLAWLALVRARMLAAAFGLAWIWIAFLPTSNLLPLVHAKAERHVFLSTFGLGLLLAQAGPAGLRRLGAPAVVAPLLAVLLCGGLASRTWVRAPDWRSTFSLFGPDVAGDPLYREGRYWLAALSLEQGRTGDALGHLEVLLEQLPHLPGHSSYLPSDPRYLYCQALLRSGDAEAARAWVAELASSHPKRAQRPEMQLCLAQAWEAVGRYGEALAVYRRLGSVDHPEPRALVGLARGLARLGRRAEAREALSKIPSARWRDPSLAPQIREVERSIGGAAP